ncbi:hypothetical protein Syun_007486 [Stephania yunnanensis]|uniref:Uncharacterized protein n=1 Tax=Stephania yunnanensis TaxID=152371 RepID=A0AAP0L161_9MAGN
MKSCSPSITVCFSFVVRGNLSRMFSWYVLSLLFLLVRTVARVSGSLSGQIRKSGEVRVHIEILRWARTRTYWATTSEIVTSALVERASLLALVERVPPFGYINLYEGRASLQQGAHSTIEQLISEPGSTTCSILQTPLKPLKSSKNASKVVRWDNIRTLSWTGVQVKWHDQKWFEDFENRVNRYKVRKPQHR